MKKVKRTTFLTLFLAAVLAISPLGVFAADEFGSDDNTAPAAEAVMDAETPAADNDYGSVGEELETEEQAVESEAAYASRAKGNWNADRSQFIKPDGTPMAGRLFIADKKDGSDGLYYAKPDGYIRKTTGLLKINSSVYYVIIPETGLWGTTDTAHQYYINNANDPYIVETSAVYGTGSNKYFVTDRGVVRTEQGIVTTPKGNRYYVREGGKIRTSKGFVKNNGYVYYVQDGGKIRLKKGKFTVDGEFHIIKGNNGCVLHKEGFTTLNGYRYYVTGDNYGQLARSTTLTRTSGGKTYRYHINKNGVVKKNKHTWNGHPCLANDKGVLKTTGIYTYSGKKYYVQDKYGRIAVKDRISYGGNTYFASKDGHLLTGVISWYDGKYYYCKDNCALKTDKGIFQYNRKYYYNYHGGGLATNTYITNNFKHYYAGSNAAFMTSRFRTSNGTLVYPNSTTGEISFSDWNKAHGNKWRYYQYVDVSISSQTLTYYLNGEVFLKCNIVSGRPGYDTSLGTYKLTQKLNNQTSTMGDKTIRFDYLMKFASDQHDAMGDGPYWMVTYGGSYYKTNGSDGEILLPYNSAKSLFYNVPVNTYIIIH